MSVDIFRKYAPPDLRVKLVTLRAQNALADRRDAFGPARSACRTFGTWIRDGATPMRAASAAIATYCALSAF